MFGETHIFQVKMDGSSSNWKNHWKTSIFQVLGGAILPGIGGAIWLDHLQLLDQIFDNFEQSICDFCVFFSPFSLELLCFLNVQQFMIVTC